MGQLDHSPSREMEQKQHDVIQKMNIFDWLNQNKKTLLWKKAASDHLKLKIIQLDIVFLVH